jgi:hypothetical protein
MEARGKAAKEHVDTKFFNGDVLGSSSNFSGSHEVDEVLDVLLNGRAVEAKGGKLFDALILSIHIFARVLAIDEIPHFRCSFKLNKARLKLSRAIGKDNSLRASSGLDSEIAVTWSNGSSSISLVFILKQELDGIIPEVEVVGVKLDVSKQVLLVSRGSKTLNLLMLYH